MLKISFSAGILKVNDENSRIRIQDPDSDPLVRGMDPRNRIRIQPKMSWIRNTAHNRRSSFAVNWVSQAFIVQKPGFVKKALQLVCDLTEVLQQYIPLSASLKR